MSRQSRGWPSLFIAAAVAALFLMPSAGEARGLGMARGRTKAIKVRLAKQINKRNMRHIGNKVKPSDIRIRTKRVSTPKGRRYIVGSSHRSVKWKLKSGILRGTARSMTPVVPNGGRHTSIRDFRITLMPRGGIKAKAR